jgi:hypothetical protein
LFPDVKVLEPVKHLLDGGVGVDELLLGGELEELGHVVEKGEEDDGDDERLGRVNMSERKMTFLINLLNHDVFMTVFGG